MAALLLPLLFGTGCASVRTYSVTSLPAELQAASVTNAQTLDLSRFAGPPDSAERIDNGDVLKISLAAGLESDQVSEFFARVGEDGTALLPSLGRVQLSGLQLPQAEQQITMRCVQSGQFRQPLVTVTMEQQRINRVTVVGGVEEPGIQELPRGSSYLLAALVAAGGLAEDAGTRVTIKHPTFPGRLASYVQPDGTVAPGTTGPTDRICLDLADVTEQGGGREYLYDGSVVTVEKRYPEPISVIGLVREPGQYEFPVTHDLRLLDAIAQAGGLTSRLANKVRVLRKADDGQEMVAVNMSIGEAKRNSEANLRLAPGDIISVEPTPLTMAEEVLNRVVRVTVGGSLGLF